ncbi:HD domain-containing phosphohydrolase [Roseateles sp. DXS20W]|uniref:HD domain-containing phosphohydrolase n=1 Tax=Pelomonas lactea TaxID=3299030 RepID=A0ABW7GF42_9BURK
MDTPLAPAVPTAAPPPVAQLACTLLFVDDEPAILNALRRLFRPLGHRILLAESGEAALQLLAQEKVDLVLSDMRMPGMDGAQLLQAVCQGWPDVARLLLTGYADIGSIVAAVNQGEIQRYIAKPWDDQELLLAVREGLERARLREENRRLQALTQAHNAELERRVAARTAELSQVNDMLERAFAELRESFLLSVKVFAGLMELREAGQAGHAERVGQLARRLAAELGLSSAQQDDCYAAGLLHEVGKIGLPDALLRKPVSMMRGEELALYRRYPLLGEAALMPLTGLRGAARLVRAHQERIDGLGFPDGLGGADLPVAAQVVGLAAAFEGLQAGRLSERRHDEARARAVIHGTAGTHFAPAVVAAFERLASVAPAPATQELALPASELRPGMVMASDLLSPQGTLLLAAGFVFDAGVIATLRDLVAREGLGTIFRIRDTRAAAAPTVRTPTSLESTPCRSL